MDGGDAILFVAGGGDTVANRLLMLLFCAADCACGAANCVEDVMVEVDAGGAMPKVAPAALVVAAGAAGAAD